MPTAQATFMVRLSPLACYTAAVISPWLVGVTKSGVNVLLVLQEMAGYKRSPGPALDFTCWFRSHISASLDRWLAET
jgi:hypothetical protein